MAMSMRMVCQVLFSKGGCGVGLNAGIAVGTVSSFRCNRKEGQGRTDGRTDLAQNIIVEYAFMAKILCTITVIIRPVVYTQVVTTA